MPGLSQPSVTADQHRGFTMIELIVVIVILGILAATVLPKYIDLSGDASASALEGIAKTAGSAMVVNYGGCSSAGHSTADPTRCRAIRYCDDVDDILMRPLDAAAYTVDHADLGTVNGVTGLCTVTQVDTGDTSTFGGIATGNP